MGGPIMDCTCRDGIVCDACAAALLALSPSDNPILTTEEVNTLTNEVTAFLNTLKPVEGEKL
jgi:hypothetical protein